MKGSKFLSAPTPGENLTTDTRNYPWHRPPQFPEFDDAFEFVVDEILTQDAPMAAAMTMATNGVNAVAIVQTLMLNMVSKGRVSPDMTLLLAGPVYKTLTRMFDMAGVSYLSGFDTREELAAYAEKLKSDATLSTTKPPAVSAESKKEMKEVAEQAKEQELPKGGLMGAPTDEPAMEIPMEEAGEGLAMESPAEDEENV